ncbi:SDR family oxidoreductase [Luteimonas yindakuii]|uniref:SDR family oxidoreductase n=1 Tax=Luteimonas yindakuii TaxID=2565782 RepID=A0A4Z1R3P7_9GAMM|nr:SDR family oxidoreductase [Luteimonas yindakuii]TKS53165.1 SDR family oxidoreductase [Luteimonas yindakuii]
MSTRTRICLVTGANRGIGLEFTRQLLARGDRVVATARQPGKATALNTLAGEYPGRLHVLPLDITQPRTHAELARELPLAVGDDVRIDLLINNAGVLHSGERFGALGLDTLEHSFRTNAAGPLLLTQTLAPQLANGARVVNMSSRIGAIALTRRFGTPSYAISKAALNMATALLGQALSPHDIVVVAVSPGWVRTEMGGADAEVATADAVAGLLAQIERLAMTDSGSFFDWQGAPIPW